MSQLGKVVRFALIGVLVVGGVLVGVLYERHRKILSVMEPVLSGEYAGFVACEMSGGRERWVIAGCGDCERGFPMAPDSVFRICSMSKSFCGVLTALYIAEGRLSLDDQVEKWLPEYRGTGITLRHCLTMTAGFPFQGGTKQAKGDWSAISVREEARELASGPKIGCPGERFSYCNAGFDVVAAVLETIEGRPYDDILKRRILIPLKMASTGFVLTPEMAGRRVTATCSDGAGSYQNAEHLACFSWGDDGRPRPVSAAGGLFSTGRDLMKFFGMLANDGRDEDGRVIVPPAAMDLLIHKQTPENVKQPYSLGFILKDGRLLGNGAMITRGYADPRSHRAGLFLMQLVEVDAYAFRLPDLWDKEVKLTTEHLGMGNSHAL